ncbi:MAG: hypothetical protein GXY36_06105 [Chloroflexi bacterium]|nr:hypothetical protein [Chloroflexota bacterium]
MARRLLRLTAKPHLSSSSYLILARLIAPATGFIFWSGAAQLYQAEAVGMASAIVSTGMLVSMLSGLGIAFSIVRFLPEAASPVRLINAAFAFLTISALIVSGVFLLGLPWWSPELRLLRQDGVYLSTFLGFVTASSLFTATEMVFLSRGQASYVLLQTVLTNGSRLILAVLFMQAGAIGLVGAVALSVLASVLVSFIILIPRLFPGYRFSPSLSGTKLRPIVAYSMGNYVSNVMTQLPHLLMPLLILEILGSEASGYAYITWMIAKVLAVPGIALSDSAFAEASHDPARLRPIMGKSVLLGQMLTLPAAFVLLIGAPWILSVFGAGYRLEATGLLRWLVLASPLMLIANIYFAYLRVQKQVIRLVLCSGLLAAAAIAGSAVFMPDMGITATGISWLVTNLGITLIAGINILAHRTS